MNTDTYVYTPLAAALTAGLMLFGTPALADQGPAAKSPPAQEQVTVRGMQFARSHIGSSEQMETGGFGYEALTLTHHVSYADLNLTSPADALELKERINDSAKSVCEQLAKVRPVQPDSSPSAATCYFTAVKGAMKQAQAAIAEAKR